MLSHPALLNPQQRLQPYHFPITQKITRELTRAAAALGNTLGKKGGHVIKGTLIFAAVSWAKNDAQDDDAAPLAE